MRYLLFLLTLGVALTMPAQEGFPVVRDGSVCIITKGGETFAPQSIAPMMLVNVASTDTAGKEAGLPMPRFTSLAYGSMTDAYDGDTYTFRGRLGWENDRMSMTVRAWGLDTPEIRGGSALEKKAAQLVRDYVRSLFESSEVILESRGRGKYGRAMADIWIVRQALHLNQHLIDRGFALPYDGGRKSAWTKDQLRAIVKILPE